MKHLFKTIGEAIASLTSQDGSPKVHKKHKGDHVFSEEEVFQIQQKLSTRSEDLTEQIIEALKNKDFVKELLFIEATADNSDVAPVDAIHEACTEYAVFKDVGLAAYNALYEKSITEAIEEVTRIGAKNLFCEIDRDALDTSVKTVVYASNRIHLSDFPSGKSSVDHDNLDTMCNLLQKAHNCTPKMRHGVLLGNKSILNAFEIDKNHSNAYNVATKKIRRIILHEWYNTGYYPPSKVERYHLGRYLFMAVNNVVHGAHLWSEAAYVMQSLSTLVSLARLITESPQLSHYVKISILNQVTFIARSFDHFHSHGISASLILFNRYRRGHATIEEAAPLSTRLLNTVKSIEDGEMHYDDNGTLYIGSQFGANGVVENNGSTTVHTGKFHTKESRTMGTLFEQAEEPEEPATNEEVTFTSLFGEK